MNMFAFGGAVLAVVAGASGALAADLPGRRAAPAPQSFLAPTPVYNWTGFYAGVNGGVDFASFGKGRGFFGKSTGGLIGGTAGYNYQVNQFVAGVEGDWDYSSASKRRTPLPGVTTTAKISSIATARVRLGYAADRALVYVTGGYAGAQIKNSIADPARGIFASQGNFRNGYALGGGIEYAFTNNISAKAEYIYTAFQKKTVAPGTVDVASSSPSASIIRAGLNYKF